MKKLELNNSNLPTSNNIIIGATAGKIDFRSSDISSSVFNWKYEIGEYVAGEGGIIFHRSSTGLSQSYWITATADIGTSRWSGVSTIIGASAQSLSNGLQNSNAIVSQLGHTASAAKLCLDSVDNGKTDWYLPSFKELDLLGTNIYEVSKTIDSVGGQQMTLAIYWTSTEYNFTNFAMYISFNSQASLGANKSNVYRVRPVRKFTI